jgi:uncharacterized membrane protein YfcA
LSFIAFIMAGLFCGFVDSCLGMGYGVTATSVLVTYGVAPIIASASIHTSEAVVDIVSAISHYKLKNVNFHITPYLLLPGIVASVLGAVFLSGLGLSTARPFIRIMLIAIGAYIIWQNYTERSISSILTKGRAAVLGFIAAFVDVAVGGGWGPIGTPALILNGEDPRKAVGTIEFTEPIISLVAVMTFGVILGFETFMWSLALPLIVGGILIAPVASILTARIPKGVLGILIGLWLIVLNIYGLLA